MRIIRKVFGVLCISVGTFLLLVMAMLPVAFSEPADYNMGINWNAVFILVVVQISFMTVGFLLFRWEHYAEKRLECKQRQREKKLEKEQEKQWQIREEMQHPIRAWCSEKKETQIQRKPERKQTEVRAREEYIDRPNGQVPQRATVHFNRHADTNYFLCFGFFLTLAVGSLLVTPTVIELDRKILLILTCILTVTFWVGFVGAIWCWQLIVDSKTKAFLTTNERLLYHIKFASRDYGRTPYTKIGQLAHNSKVISAESELRSERECYLHSTEFLRMAERVINGTGVPERECVIECLNSPRIVRGGINGMQIRYWDEKTEKWRGIRVPKSNEGYEIIRGLVKQRNYQYD